VTTRYRHDDPHHHLLEAMIALAGPLAEQHYHPTSKAEREALWREHWHGDLARARWHVAACGGDGQWIARQVRVLIHKHWVAIERVAAALQREQELSGAELDALIEGK
jgi:hypothetical protein